MINLYKFYNTPKQLDPPLKNPTYLRRYAQVVGKLSSDQEDIIAKSGMNSYYYAIDVLKGQFLKGEPAMLKYCDLTQVLDYGKVGGHLYD